MFIISKCSKLLTSKSYRIFKRNFFFLNSRKLTKTFYHFSNLSFIIDKANIQLRHSKVKTFSRAGRRVKTIPHDWLNSALINIEMGVLLDDEISVNDLWHYGFRYRLQKLCLFYTVNFEIFINRWPQKSQKFEEMDFLK